MGKEDPQSETTAQNSTTLVISVLDPQGMSIDVTEQFANRLQQFERFSLLHGHLKNYELKQTHNEGEIRYLNSFLDSLILLKKSPDNTEAQAQLLSQITHFSEEAKSAAGQQLAEALEALLVLRVEKPDFIEDVLFPLLVDLKYISVDYVNAVKKVRLMSTLKQIAEVTLMVSDEATHATHRAAKIMRSIEKGFRLIELLLNLSSVNLIKNCQKQIEAEKEEKKSTEAAEPWMIRLNAALFGARVLRYLIVWPIVALCVLIRMAISLVTAPTQWLGNTIAQAAGWEKDCLTLPKEDAESTVIPPLVPALALSIEVGEGPSSLPEPAELSIRASSPSTRSSRRPADVLDRVNEVSERPSHRP